MVTLVVCAPSCSGEGAVSETDPLGNTTSYVTDDAGDLVTVVRPTGIRLVAEYNELHLPVSVTEPNGAIWRWAYDERGNVTASTDPTGATTTYTHDERGHLLAFTDQLGHTRRFDTNAPASGCPPPTRRARPPGTPTMVSVASQRAPTRSAASTRFGWTVEGRPAWRVLPDGAAERRTELCQLNGVTDLAQACVACMSVAVRFLGEWDRALAICRDVLSDEHAAAQGRMVATEESGLITALRGNFRHARGPLRRAAAFGRSREIFGIELGATWGLAVVEDLDGDHAAALRGVSTMVERCQETEDHVFALPALRWAATFLAVRGERDGLASCHRLLATAATQNSSSKVLFALAHVGGEMAMADGAVAQSAAQFGRAVELLAGVTAPFEQAMSQLRWGIAWPRRTIARPRSRR